MTASFPQRLVARVLFPVIMIALLAAGCASGLMARRHRGFARLFWAGCALLLWAGLIGGALVVLVPVEQLDQNGNVIGEMPPAFAVALAMVATGMAGALGGGVIKGILAIRRRRRGSAG